MLSIISLSLESVTILSSLCYSQYSYVLILRSGFCLWALGFVILSLGSSVPDSHIIYSIIFLHICNSNLILPAACAFLHSNQNDLMHLIAYCLLGPNKIEMWLFLLTVFSALRIQLLCKAASKTGWNWCVNLIQSRFYYKKRHKSQRGLLNYCKMVIPLRGGNKC